MNEPRDTEPIGPNAPFRAYGRRDLPPEVDYSEYDDMTWVEQLEPLQQNLGSVEEFFRPGNDNGAYEMLALLERNVVYAREWMLAMGLVDERAKENAEQLWTQLRYTSPKS